MKSFNETSNSDADARLERCDGAMSRSEPLVKSAWSTPEVVVIELLLTEAGGLSVDDGVGGFS
jgi:hypothetical protein